MTKPTVRRSRRPRLLYVSLHATAPGQTGWADIDEVVARFCARGWTVDLRQPSYVGRVPPGGLARLAETMAIQVGLLWRLRGYDAMYVRSSVQNFPLALAARLADVPVIQECNGAYVDAFIAWPRLRRAKAILNQLARLQYRWADEVITVTPRLALWLKSESGHRRVSVIPNGANVELFHPQARQSRALPQPYAVFFGSLAPWQGIATMLAATRHAAWPEGVHLVIAGDGALRSEVQHAAERGRVLYLVGCPQSDLAGIVAGSIGSLSVQHDPMRARFGFSPLKLYESMAAGVPVIVSDAPGLEDVVTRFECGLVVRAGDAAALARAVAELASHPDLRRRYGDNGRTAAVNECSWDAAADATALVVERAIRRRI